MEINFNKQEIQFQRTRIAVSNSTLLFLFQQREEDILETAKILGAKRTTAYSIVGRGTISINRGGARNTKMEDEMIQKLREIFGEDIASGHRSIEDLGFKRNARHKAPSQI